MSAIRTPVITGVFCRTFLSRFGRGFTPVLSKRGVHQARVECTADCNKHNSATSLSANATVFSKKTILELFAL